MMCRNTATHCNPNIQQRETQPGEPQIKKGYPGYPNQTTRKEASELWAYLKFLKKFFLKIKLF